MYNGRVSYALVGKLRVKWLFALNAFFLLGLKINLAYIDLVANDVRITT
jgi:hypothetical protein